MSIKEFVRVPIRDIEMIEKARKDIISILNNLMGDELQASVRMSHITQPMWRLTHRKYLKWKEIVK